MCRMFALMVGLASLTLPARADWPQWRGPHRDGSAPNLKLPEKWPDKLRQNYKLDAGEGHASPVFVDGKVILFLREKDKEVVRCFDAKFGKKDWEHSYPVSYLPDPMAKSHGSGPKSTPTCFDGRVYTLGMTAQLHCIQIKSGKVVWHKDLKTIIRGNGPQFGTASSVLIEGDLAVVLTGGEKEGVIVAFDCKTGKERWRTPIDGPAYGSPIAAEIAGVRQIVTLTRAEFLAVNPVDGKVLWRHQFTTAYEQNILTPVVWNDLVIISGHKKPTTAYKVKREGDKVTSAPHWSNDKVRMYISSPVVADDHLYGLEENGEIFCIDLKTGRTQWSKGNFGDYASLIVAGNRLLVFDTRGELTLLEVNTKEYKELHRIKVSAQATWAYPAFGEIRFWVRDRDQLICYDIPQ